MSDRVLAAVVRAIQRDEDEAGIAEEVMRELDSVNVTVALALLNRVHALEEGARRLADAAATIADHERGYPSGATDVVIEGRQLGPDDRVHRVTVAHLRELREAVLQTEEAFWPADTGELSPELVAGIAQL